MSDGDGIVVILVIIGIFIVPFIFIWAINTILNLHVEYTCWTWLAVVIILSIIYSVTRP